MFVADFQVFQGVLFVDTSSIATNYIAESPPASELNFLNGYDLQANLASAEVLLGDAPVLKLQALLSANIFLGEVSVPKQLPIFIIENCLNENVSFSINLTAFVVMLAPGNAPPPNPN